MPRFHCLLPVRDEADIIVQSLEHMLAWADAIYVFDTGSVDETWEIVQEMAARDTRVRPMKKDPVYYSENLLRGWMFNEARKEMRPGDWFLRVDADEFHHIPPPEFIQKFMKPHETVAWHQYYDFRLTVSEVTKWESGLETKDDRVRPISERRRFFTPSIYSEPRLCRYRTSMQWPREVSFPYNAGYVARMRLPIRHYPHRDPAQLERRCRIRAIMMADRQNRAHWTHPDQHHWSEGEWRKFITPDDLPSLKYWERGTQLPVYHFQNHLSNSSRRLIQRFVHASMLPLLDSFRRTWKSEDYPQKIPYKIQKELYNKTK